VVPLVRARLLPHDWPYTVHAVSGYSGGGKGLIERFEADRDIAYRAYGLRLGHKHIDEMQKKAGLEHPPVFSPAVVPAHRGMVVEVPLPLEAMMKAGKPGEMLDCLLSFYEKSPVVQVCRTDDTEILLRASMEPTDRMQIFVFADEEEKQARLVAVLDNLGKGASGAAVQSLNLMAGCPETAGLRL
jgi:N-acetyl-gamma-glutamyl-phosphate reductase